jgi:hypothetical protein
MAEALPELAEKDRGEHDRLPGKARDALSTWFHGPCLNAVEFVYDVSSEAFAERLAACPTEPLKLECVADAFFAKVVSHAEILDRVRKISRDLGAELDQNWADCCRRIAGRWDGHLRLCGPNPLGDLSGRVEPLVRDLLNEAVQRERSAGRRPSLSETAGAIGECALSALAVARSPKLAGFVFVLMALGPICAHLAGMVRARSADRKRAASAGVAQLAGRIGAEFEVAMGAQIDALHGWQEGALRRAAESYARDTIGLWEGIV